MIYSHINSRTVSHIGPTANIVSTPLSSILGYRGYINLYWPHQSIVMCLLSILVSHRVSILGRNHVDFNNTSQQFGLRSRNKTSTDI